ncbi:hypothetical protein CYY_007098 [Polysphondylium violaceum]|uniref:Uncharacterized protein n=1 Tax=Polysphondylium violaceum TaxID=133409 RepID=A0A8J4PQ25_9MYCE|nr:hypothetical protein CYY_007098 [Polysphondylium violaceum]
MDSPAPGASVGTTIVPDTLPYADQAMHNLHGPVRTAAWIERCLQDPDNPLSKLISMQRLFTLKKDEFSVRFFFPTFKSEKDIPNELHLKLLELSIDNSPRFTTTNKGTTCHARVPHSNLDLVHQMLYSHPRLCQIFFCSHHVLLVRTGSVVPQLVNDGFKHLKDTLYLLGGAPEVHSTILLEGDRLAGLALYKKNMSMPIYEDGVIDSLRQKNIIVKMKLFSNSKAKLKTSDDPPLKIPSNTSPSSSFTTSTNGPSAPISASLNTTPTKPVVVLPLEAAPTTPTKSTTTITTTSTVSASPDSDNDDDTMGPSEDRPHTAADICRAMFFFLSYCNAKCITFFENNTRI